MTRIMQMGLARSRFVAFPFTVTLLIAVLLAGCGGKGGDQLTAPTNAGTAQALAGTNWVEPESNVTYNFVDEGTVSVSKPWLDAPNAGTFAVNNGIVELSFGLKVEYGTWDGNVLTIENQALTRK